MITILNILLGFFILMFSGVAITFVGGWLLLQLFDNKENLKEENMKPKINDFSKKTKVSGMGGVGGPIDVIRGKKQTPTNEPREENDPNPTQK
jgi:hypothetical protein